jgi:hypothetical protein
MVAAVLLSSAGAHTRAALSDRDRQGLAMNRGASLWRIRWRSSPKRWTDPAPRPRFAADATNKPAPVLGPPTDRADVVRSSNQRWKLPGRSTNGRAVSHATLHRMPSAGRNGQ